MPAPQSDTPDIFIKQTENFELAEDTSALDTKPSVIFGANAATLVLRTQNSTTVIQILGAVGAAGFPEIVNADTSTLAPGFYDGEWLFTNPGADTLRLPGSRFLFVEIVEKLS